jgi:quinol---cytochrome-c reductase cytochrome b subunit
VQINPIWLWGPYHVASATNGAQPDWYLGWLIGALRLMPSWDFVIGRYTLVPNPFWGGVLLPGAVFGFLYLWPWLERRASGDFGWFNLVDRPRDRPWRTAIGVAVASFVLIVFLAGSADRIAVSFGISYSSQIWAYRGALLVVPLLALVVTKRICVELVAGERVERIRRVAEAEARQPAR